MKDFYDIYYPARTFDFDGKMCRQSFLKPCGSGALPIIKKVLAGLMHLPKIIANIGGYDKFQSYYEVTLKLSFYLFWELNANR